MTYKPKRGGQGPTPIKEEDVPMKIEAEQDSQPQPRRGGRRPQTVKEEDQAMKIEGGEQEHQARRGGKPRGGNKQARQEEEKKGGAPFQKPPRRTHNPSKEEGFTGDKDSWFDGKQKRLNLSYRHHL